MKSLKTTKKIIRPSKLGFQTNIQTIYAFDIYRIVGEIQEFVTANSLLIKQMVSVLSTFSSGYMISTLFG